MATNSFLIRAAWASFLRGREGRGREAQVPQLGLLSLPCAQSSCSPYYGRGAPYTACQLWLPYSTEQAGPAQLPGRLGNYGMGGLRMEGKSSFIK